MEQLNLTRETAETANYSFELEIYRFLHNWIFQHEDDTLLRFDQSLVEYLSNNALRDFFMHSVQPLKQLLKLDRIAKHLGRSVSEVYFDSTSGDPLLAPTEQRIYNLAHRMDSERTHVPFRSVHPFKQTEAGDNADITTYPVESDIIRYNVGNHFTSRPANENVSEVNSKRCRAKSAGNLEVIFKKGYLEDRLHEIKERMIAAHEAGEKELQFFVICSRHSLQEGHFGTSLITMDPSNPYFPVRVLVCDTLLKDLPHHPRWWNHFVAEYANVFGDAIKEMIEDLSHPLQKVNVKGDNPYNHDWDCPYYVTSMTEALADIVLGNQDLIVSGSLQDVHNAMKGLMPDYYLPDQIIKDRQDIKKVNQVKRWDSGLEVIKELLSEVVSKSSYKV